MSPTQQQEIVNSPKPDPAPPRSSKKRTRLPQPDRTPTYRGVRRRSWGRYVSEIRLPGQKTRVWLGSFGSPEMAARAYDSAAFFLKGSSACLNFPDLVGSLPQPESCSTRDIQMAAAKAAFITKSENTDLSNRAECGRMEGSVDELPPQSSAWLGSDGCYYDPGTEWFEEVKDAPLLSPLRFDSGSSSSISSWEELFGSSVDDEEFLLASCFQL